MAHNSTNDPRYERQMILPEIGREGQEKLAHTKVLVVGAGGLGSPVLQYLAAAGVGTLGIVDGDTVALHNLHRQVLYGDGDIGKLKVECAVKRLTATNPTLRYQAFPYNLDHTNAVSLVQQFDFVVDASDNFTTRYLINDACVLTGRAFVAASILGFEGQLATFNLLAKNGASRGATLRCVFADPSPPGAAPNCAAHGVLGPVAGTLGCLQALEVIKVIVGLDGVLSNKFLTMNLLTGETKVLKCSRDETQVARVLQYGKPLEESAACQFQRDKRERGTTMSSPVKTITVKELQAKRESGEDFQLIDVREPNEYAQAQIGGELIPLQTLPENLDKVSRTKPVVIHCRSGGRSERACEFLMQQGITNVTNLTGGITAWAREIDPSLKVG